MELRWRSLCRFINLSDKWGRNFAFVFMFVNYKNFRKSFICGFTLIEVLISASILFVIAAVSLGYLTNYRKGVDVDTETEKIAGYLKQVQSRAKNGESGTAWGVHFVNSASDRDYYQTFSGSVYYATTTIETVYVSGAVDFSDPTSGQTKDVVFQRINGWPTSVLSISIVSRTNAEETKTISVNSAGIINY